MASSTCSTPSTPPTPPTTPGDAHDDRKEFFLSIPAEVDEFTAVAQKLRKEILHIPNLQPLYARWPQRLSPHYERLVGAINEHVEAAFPDDEAYVQRAKKMDFASFLCRIYPDAEWSRLLPVALFIVFLFLYDDEIDRAIEPDVHDVASDLSAADRFREDMMGFIEDIFDPESRSLASNTSSSISKADDTNTTKGLRALISAAAPDLVAASDQVDTERFLKDMSLFATWGTKEEQRLRLSRRFPTLEELAAIRNGTGALDVICDVHQYVTDTRIPDGLAWVEEVLVMRAEVSYQTCVSNDLFSLQKEIKEDTMLSLVPTMMHATGQPLDKIVRQVVADLYASADRFDKATESLKAKAEAFGPEMLRSVASFVAAFETFQTGCFHYYVRSRRYGVSKYELPDGSFAIPLGGDDDGEA